VPRFFAEIYGQVNAVVRGRDVRHITGPLRKTVGDHLAIRDHEKGYIARISSINPHEISLEILSSQTLHERGSSIVHLGISLIDLKDMDELVRVVTELGVSEIHPVIARYSNIREVGEKRMLRWQQIIQEAVKQCERRDLPKLNPIRSLDGVLAEVSPSWPSKLVASIFSDTPVHDCRTGEVGILIGPEGGFSPDESARIEASGFKPVHLGKTVLRSWTAAITAVGILTI
jgi:16S rRNA (uracil1498-N3)-methyltransferase